MMVILEKKRNKEMKNLFTSVSEKLRFCSTINEKLDASTSRSNPPGMIRPSRKSLFERLSLNKIRNPQIPRSLPSLSTPLYPCIRTHSNPLFGKSNPIISESNPMSPQSSSELVNAMTLPQQHIANIMSLCVRDPQHSFIGHRFRITNSILGRLKYACESLGLERILTPQEDSRNYIPKHRKLVEVLTSYQGCYGHFLVLVTFGVGCTVWYTTGLNLQDIVPPTEMLNPEIRSELPEIKYGFFCRDDYDHNNFDKVTYLETKKVSKEVFKSIENLTMHFDEECIFKSSPDILRMIIDEKKESARDFLRSKLDSEDDLALIAELGQYTLEALIVHVLCVLFSSAEGNIMIRVATMVEQLEGNTRSQAKIVRQRRFKAQTAEVSPGPSQDSGRKKTQLVKMYPIGSALVEFMEQRGLITLSSDSSGSDRVMKKGDSYYLPNALYVICNFEISLLPIKLNLPMVFPPLDWKSAKDKAGSLSDLTGGYLSNPTSEMYDRYKLLSSTNLHNFYLELKEPDKLCAIMNCLQSKPFQIKTGFLIYLIRNEKTFVDHGLLAPGFVAYMNIMDCTSKLRELYMKNDYIRENFTYNELLLTLQKDIQRARYEKLIFELAMAYEGYSFYLPAFLDFRGRIYRCGVLHFHERDLSRSLVEFAEAEEHDLCVAVAATCFQFQSFKSENAVLCWVKQISKELQKKGISPTSDIHLMDPESAKHLVALSVQAKHPFQFLSGFLSVYFNQIDSIMRMPITQDASASAYQIMSYLLLDETMARKTNLIPSPEGEIEDIYTSILHELNSYIGKKIEDSALSSTLIEVLDRKIVKSIFMPIIYGKTVMSTAYDIKGSLSRYLTHKECFMVANLCFEFWKDRFHNMDCLIRLVRSIGWIASSSGRSVQYEVANFRTIQDYVKMEAINIWIYDRLHKKRRQVTLRVASDTRDRRKTEISTFVNFIHQKDAHIAMNVVEAMLYLNAPIYTVHDNFITTSYHSKKVALVYSRAMKTLGSPLQIINTFIYLNLVQHLSNQEGFSINKVITSARLKQILDQNIPENIGKSKMKAWDERINTIVNSYNHYTTLICGKYLTPEEGGRLHREKYKKFCEKMEKKPKIPLYSVHY